MMSRFSVFDVAGSRGGSWALSSLALAGTLFVGACAGAEGSSSGGASAAEDDPVVVDAFEPLAGTDIATHRQESDVVVRGRAVSAEQDVEIGDSSLTYTVFTVEVAEVLSGDADGTVEVAMSTKTNGREMTLEGRPDVEVGDDGVWFLTRIDPEEFDRDGYVLTSSSGLVLAGDDGEPGEGLDHHSPIAEELDQLDSVDEVADHVKTISEEDAG